MEQSEKTIPKAMGRKKVTEQPMKQVKEKVRMLGKKGKKQRKAAHQQRLRAWQTGGKKKRHRPKELAPLRRKLSTWATGVRAERPSTVAQRFGTQRATF